MKLPPARIGMSVSEVDTPALLVDLDAFTRNLDRMVHSLEGKPVRLRAHAKTHKCPTIAQQQISRGAVGVCCQTLGEAEAMVAGGVTDVLITNQIVSSVKISRLIELVKQADVMVCVDSSINVDDLNRAAGVAGVGLRVLVEIDIGQNRCGVDPGEPALVLARAVAACTHLKFAGLQAYHGKAQHLYDFGARTKVMEQAFDLVRSTVDLLRQNGLACEIVSGGGTGTYELEAASGVYNEVQAGSYVFMDADYLRVEGPDRLFEQALFVLTTVISRTGNRAVCDAGLKASSIDSGMPEVWNRPGVQFLSASDEHGMLQVEDPVESLKPSDQLWLIPGHCDPTVNLYDWFVGVGNGRVEALWPITGRGSF